VSFNVDLRKKPDVKSGHRDRDHLHCFVQVRRSVDYFAQLSLVQAGNPASPPPPSAVTTITFLYWTFLESNRLAFKKESILKEKYWWRGDRVAAAPFPITTGMVTLDSIPATFRSSQLTGHPESPI
jgi:hypothetical protein